MIEILDDGGVDFIAIRASGIVTERDCKESILPIFDACVAEYGRVRALIYLDEGVKGEGLGTLLNDEAFGLARRKEIEKIAVVGGPKWIGWSLKLAGKLIEGEIKSFSTVRAEHAKQWLNVIRT